MSAHELSPLNLAKQCQNTCDLSKSPAIILACRPDSDSEEPVMRKKTTKTSKRSRKVYKSSVVGDFVNVLSKFTRGSAKGVFEAVTSKHVSLEQVVGKWKLLQEVSSASGSVVTCPATIELLANGTILTTFNGAVMKSEFTFKERKWPKSCTIQFSANIFQGANDIKPRAMIYKGYFKKSLLNPGVVLIRGDMYQVSGKMYVK
jgi:hypothetical protein